MGRESRANSKSRENFPNQAPKVKPKTKIKQLRERALRDRIERMKVRMKTGDE